jgi:hypothetical protein
VVSGSRDYKLLVSRAELTTLLADLGKQVYFVPNYAPDDGEDHTAYVQTVQLGPNMEVTERDRDLSYYYVTIHIQES